MDLALEAAGAFGKFQKVVALIVISVGTIPLILSITFPFVTKQPNYLCREKGNIFDSFYECHEEHLCKPELFDYIKDEKNSLNNMTYSFDLTCDRSYWINIFGSVFFFGGIIGSFVLAPIPDRYGREKIYKILILLNLIMQINILFAVSELHIAIINFISGFISYAMSMCTLVITEYIHRSQGGTLMTIHSSVFPFTGVMIALFFMYINNWRVLFLITTLYSCFIYYAVMKYFVESPLWLKSNKRFSECIDVLKRIAEINGNSKTFETYLENNPNLYNNMDNNDNAQQRTSSRVFNLFEIFNLKSQRLNMICLTYVWFASGFCFYGLILNLEHLGGNLFINSIVTFIGEMFSELVSGYLAEEFGRVIVLKTSGFIGGIGFILYEFIDQRHWYRSIFIFMTSFGFSGTFNLIYIYSPEVFPTTIRSTVMGFLYFSSRIGALLVPSITPFVPHNPVLFGILSICTSIISVNLKETLGKEIPDDVPENFEVTSKIGSSGNTNNKISNYRRTIVSDEYFKVSEFTS